MQETVEIAAILLAIPFISWSLRRWRLPRRFHDAYDEGKDHAAPGAVVGAALASPAGGIAIPVGAVVGAGGGFVFGFLKETFFPKPESKNEGAKRRKRRRS